ncbi:MazG-like family protein [Paenibacillus qinlingensis]|uniref:NTP pyrophosphatase (Non-canonical NTP hydrolase) n=1 Tax=Paenibacillus qinlingensis TaxID=1837343 RepID=A0ABU1P0B3_9BACL|nr:MazG-like family protein [Paenibacillus qinlingensis]MDR6553160.1 NTP pyrophosphatase (non-canonical NTP hydrolase) [Paenibacillus qinlingensis]
MHISDMQKHIQQFSIEKGFDSSTVEQRALYLVTEVGEMVKELLHLSYHPDHENKEDIKKNLGLEMYDVVWNICDLANKLEINLEKAFAMKMEINKDRTW